MSDEIKKVIQTPFHATAGGFVGDESSDQIAINARLDHARMAKEDAEWQEREIEAPRRARKIQEAAEAAEKQKADEQKRADRLDKSRAGFTRSVEGAKNLVSSLRCIAARWTPETVADQPDIVALFCHDLEQLVSIVRDKQNL